MRLSYIFGRDTYKVHTTKYTIEVMLNRRKIVPRIRSLQFETVFKVVFGMESVEQVNFAPDEIVDTSDDDVPLVLTKTDKLPPPALPPLQQQQHQPPNFVVRKGEETNEDNQLRKQKRRRRRGGRREALRKERKMQRQLHDLSLAGQHSRQMKASYERRQGFIKRPAFSNHHSPYFGKNIQSLPSIPPGRRGGEWNTGKRSHNNNTNSRGAPLAAPPPNNQRPSAQSWLKLKRT